MKINVKWEVSQSSGTEQFTLDDLNCRNVAEWDALLPCEKEERIQEAVYNLPERVSMIVDRWEVK